MRRVKKPVFFVSAFLILILTLTTVFGVSVGGVDYIKGIDDIRWGVDIRGGVEATFSPSDDYEATDEELEAAKTIIEFRLVNNNITDYELYTDTANNRIIVRFPWASDETEFDAETAIEELASTAMLTFRPGMEYETYSYDEETGEITYSTPTGDTAETILIQGDEVKSAYAGIITSDSGSQEYVVNIEFSDSGTEKFAEATETYYESIISIWMDDVMLSYPTVNSVISDGECYISGSFTAAEATALASKIEGGALPFAMEVSNYSTINPSLGTTSLEAMAIAGIIAFILIAVFMITMFKLPGAVAVITLLGQTAITFAAVSGYFVFTNSFTMTLPGIAGIILSIGIGVDCTIITISRVKEELLSGKTLDGAIQNGCKNSFWAIFDGNVTILIVSIMLIGVFGPGNILSMIFGESTTGSIYSFGYTLLVGVIANFIMGVFAFRLMLKSISGFKPLRKKSLYGGNNLGK